MSADRSSAGLAVGAVSRYDSRRGTGTIVAAETTFDFQCIGIADGTREIDADEPVAFRPAARLGRWEATAIVKLSRL